jgi:aryl-alcohol dehydrogenase-like predicted oxidoreductase
MTARLAVAERPLGTSPVSVPRVMLGCGNFGGIGSAPAFFGQGLDRAAAFELMDAAWELGLRHFDTADAYGGGRSETIIGEWMRANALRPALTTKTYNPMAPGADHGLAPERIERQLHSSLERLGVDHVDLYLTHEHDPDVPADVVSGTLELLRAEGLVRAVGASNYDEAQLREALAAGPLDAVQNSHSLLVRDDEAGVIPLCERERVSYTLFSPLAGGWLTGKYRRGEAFPEGSRMTQRPEGYASFLAGDRVFDGLERLNALADEHGVSMAGLALAWLLADPRICSIVVGPMRVAHLEPVREALATPLSDDARAEVGAVFG